MSEPTMTAEDVAFFQEAAKMHSAGNGTSRPERVLATYRECESLRAENAYLRQVDAFRLGKLEQMEAALAENDALRAQLAEAKRYAASADSVIADLRKQLEAHGLFSVEKLATRAPEGEHNE